MQEPITRAELGPFAYVQWSAVVAGALAGTALAFVLMSFAAALGLAVASPSPTWRDTSVFLVILSGFWMVLVDVTSFGLAGYVAGRVRTGVSGLGAEETEFRDGIHGLLAWAVGLVIGALLLWATATAFSSARGAAAAPPNAGEPAFLSYELDRLFRGDRRPGEAGYAEARAEAGRILMRGLGRRDLPSEDRAHLSRLVALRTGLSPGDSDRRVDIVLGAAQQAAAQTRRSGVVIGFMTAAALLAAAAAAWVAAIAGGRHRDTGVGVPLSAWDWRTVSSYRVRWPGRYAPPPETPLP